MGWLAFISIFFREHRKILVLIVIAGALSGLFSAAIVAAVNAFLHPDLSRPLFLLGVGFAGLVMGKIISSVLSQLWLVQFAQDAIIALTQNLCEKLLQSSLRRIEHLGGTAIFMTLTDEVGAVVWAARCIPNLIINVAMIAGCGVYLLWLSPLVSLAVLAVSLIGAGGYYQWHRNSYPLIHAARDAKVKVFSQFRVLTDGIKELLMDDRKGHHFLRQELQGAIEAMKHRNLVALKHELMGDSWTQTLYYLLIGLLLLAFPGMLTMTPEALTGFVFAILFLMNPVWNVIGALPVTARGQIALSRLNELGMALSDDSVKQSRALIDSSPPIVPTALSLKDIRFTYRDAEGKPSFCLGPLSFSVQAGELVMIVGGNGSGKSTFAKVLTGLYPADDGVVSLGTVSIGDDNLQWYRRHFSVVFSDYYLFEGIYGDVNPDGFRAVQKYLAVFQLANKVTFANGRFSTTNLSHGQRRRLALIAALVEDKPICVFDEWAADQDPHFKAIFYETILAELCRLGKAVVVITHDDRYFHLAHRVVKLQDGRITA